MPHCPPATLRCAVLSLLTLLTACGETARLPLSETVGPQPRILEPQQTLIPTVNIAPAKGWPGAIVPTAAPGTTVTAFATGLDHPRWVYALPNGDVLVAETNAPPRPEAEKGLKGFVMKQVMKRAGAAVPSANRISLLRDTDGDGVAETRTIFLQNLNSPFGMALVGNDLYVANTDAIVRFAYPAGATQITTAGTKVTDLPAGPLNHHWTKNIIASPEGKRLYATVGSNSDHAEKGIEREDGRAAIWEVDLASGQKKLFATGLRNPNGLAWEPTTGTLWTAVNERDALGSDLVPDYLTSVRAGGFYGWPWSYYGRYVDTRVNPPRPEMVAKALVPDYALGSHVAPLGLAWSGANKLPPAFASGMFIGQHGSWNRRPASGYNVIFVPFVNGQPAGKPVDVLTGFLSESGDAYGRPVGVTIDTRGALLVADDVGNVVWRVTGAGVK